MRYSISTEICTTFVCEISRPSSSPDYARHDRERIIAIPSSVTCRPMRLFPIQILFGKGVDTEEANVQAGCDQCSLRVGARDALS